MDELFFSTQILIDSEKLEFEARASKLRSWQKINNDVLGTDINMLFEESTHYVDYKTSKQVEMAQWMSYVHIHLTIRRLRIQICALAFLCGDWIFDPASSHIPNILMFGSLNTFVIRQESECEWLFVACDWLAISPASAKIS